MTDNIADITRDLLIGRRLRLSAWDKVNMPMVRQWCEVMGNRNFRYARNNEIPVAMLHVWTMPGFDGAFPEGEAVDLLREASRQFSKLGFTGVMAVRMQQQYFRPLTLGELLHREISIESVSPVKRTAVGEGVFVTELAAVFSQSERVGTTRLTLLCFQPKRGSEKEGEYQAKPSSPPSNVLDLDTRFITSAAIATRDFEGVHIDPHAARAAGLKNIYLNIMTTLGLVQRFIEEGHGLNIVLSSIDLGLSAPGYPGDQIRFTSRWALPKQEVEFKMELRDGLHARGVAQVGPAASRRVLLVSR